jgi:hypothetical protein
VLRALVIAGGVATFVAGLLAFRSADLGHYAVYVLVGIAVALPPVEVLPRLRMPIPTMATTVGFLYIGGLPIIVLSQTAVPLLIFALQRATWADRLPQLRTGSVALRAHLLPASLGRDRPLDVGNLAEFGMFSLGSTFSRTWGFEIDTTSCRLIEAHAVALDEDLHRRVCCRTGCGTTSTKSSDGPRSRELRGCERRSLHFR